MFDKQKLLLVSVSDIFPNENEIKTIFRFSLLKTNAEICFQTLFNIILP